MKRYGMVTRLKPEGYENYKKLHAAVWPDVLKMIRECNIRNYSIYHHEGLLFSYFEYSGENLSDDMARMAADPITREWWKACTPDFDSFTEGEFWTDMEELFHLN